MASLKTADGTILPLRVWQIVGRAPGCGIQLSSRAASLEHASISWNGHVWVVRDLGSTNGTWVGGQRLAATESLPIEVGQSFTVGESDTFTLHVGGAPVPFARHADGRLATGTAELLTLPDETMIFPAADGSWRWESGAEQRRVQDLEPIAGWTLHLPSELTSTADLIGPPTLEELSLRFRVRRDEERAELAVTLPDGTVEELGSRAHTYTLLTLARQRLDAPPGWLPTEELARMLLVEPNLVYTHVFRARRQFDKLGVIGAADIVERQGDELRLGTSRVEVIRY